MRENDASGWVVANNGEQWVLESETVDTNTRDINVNFAPDVCIVAPGHAVFKFENVDVTRNTDVELPVLNLPMRSGKPAGWVVYPVDR